MIKKKKPSFFHENGQFIQLNSSNVFVFYERTHANLKI